MDEHEGSAGDGRREAAAGVERREAAVAGRGAPFPAWPLLVAAPLLVAQGAWVRRVTPKLPEADGPRQGRRGDGPPLRLLIAGDSSAAGVGADHQDRALAGRLADALARRGRTVHWRLVARTGVDARELATLLDERPPGEFDVAVLVVGVNDVTGRRSAASWRGDLDALRVRLGAGSPGAPVVASGLPPMHRFPALPQPLRAYLGARARAFDAALARWAADTPRTVHRPLPDLTDPAMVASDGFHPGPGAYAAWGEALAPLIDALARG